MADLSGMQTIDMADLSGTEPLTVRCLPVDLNCLPTNKANRYQSDKPHAICQHADKHPGDA